MNRMNLGLPFSACQAPECLKREGLKRCSACHVVPYCSPEHQRAHRQAHKFHCGLVKKALEKLASEEAALRARTDENDPEMPPNPFENPDVVGQFWYWKPTRPYMRQRFDVAVQLLNIRTGEAVEAALAHLLDMLRLCRGDNMAVRSQVPALYLRLGRDQEAFDFLKWWADKSPGYDWGVTDLPYLDIKGADPFQPIELERSGIAHDLSFKVALLMLKSRLFADISILDGFVKKLGDSAPRDKMEIVNEECMSDIMLNRRDIVDAPDYTPVMALLRQQMVDIYKNIQKHNEYILPAIDNPSLYAYEQPRAYTFGDEGEAILAYRNSWYMWSECPTVLQNILPVLKQV